METSPLAEVWRQLSDRMSQDLEGWRKAHPQATLQEIEEELDARLSGLRAHMLADLAEQSKTRAWSGQEEKNRPQCPQCGSLLQARGQHKRHLLTNGGKEVTLSREYGTCPHCGSGFFPLDEELALPSSAGVTPQLHQAVIVLGTLLPFAQATTHLQTFLKVQLSPSTIRRLTEQAGKCLEQEQDQQAQPLASCPEQEPAPVRLAMATDGVLVPVRPNEWAEVKMVTIGEVRQGEAAPECEQLSYFARLADAETFGDLASSEIRRRGVERAREVAALQDGAEWIVGFVHGHRADAVYILDFAHAASYVNESADLARAAGAPLADDWVSQQLHTLKTEGPSALLASLNLLAVAFPRSGLTEKISYLYKREAFMQYPQYQQAGWPIGSGMAESGNKQVVQARLKGAGMHWERSNVNPMLALRTTLCSERWTQGWLRICAESHTQRTQRFLARREANLTRATTRLLTTFFRLPLPILLACFPPLPSPPTSAPPTGRTESQNRWGRQTFSPRQLREQARAKI